jgi:L-amino acid N-acyltransferase YncA
MNSFCTRPESLGAIPVTCVADRHASSILALFNDAILTSTALYDYEPRTLASMETWFQAKTAGNFPVLGYENADGELMGFASYGTFRAYPANKYTVEHSVYVDARFRGKGLAEALLTRLIDHARQAQLHVLIGGIDATNQASIRLHEKMGFAHAGTIRQVGFKFGRWLDLAFYQRILDTPVEPVDG